MTATNAGPASGLKVLYMFHPSFHVPSLEDSEDFFDRVFGRPSTLLQVMPKSDEPPKPDAPKGYSKMTLINEVLIDSVCPTLHRMNGVQSFPSVDEPVLRNMGWYCADVEDTFQALRRNAFPLISQFGEPADGDEAPTVGQGGSMKMFFASPPDVGLRYQFMPLLPMPIDPRTQPGWSLPVVSADDPLGIERCAHHVVLTEQPDRGVRFIETLGGSVIHEGRDDARGISGPYVHLADAVIHFAVPDAGTTAAADLAGNLPADKYHAMTFKVVDLDRVAAHLDAQGVGILTRTDDTIVTDPATSFSTPWGFTTELTPGDPRA